MKKFDNMMAAFEATTDSSIRLGEKLSTDEVIGKELTLTAIDVSSIPQVDDNGRPLMDEHGNRVVKAGFIMAFEEYPNRYYAVGSMRLEQLCQGFLSACDGDVDAVNEELASGEYRFVLQRRGKKSIAPVRIK